MHVLCNIRKNNVWKKDIKISSAHSIKAKIFSKKNTMKTCLSVKNKDMIIYIKNILDEKHTVFYRSIKNQLITGYG